MNPRARGSPPTPARRSPARRSTADARATILPGAPGPLGLKALYSRAKLPDHLYPAVRAAVDVLVESKYDGEPYDRERFCRRIVERVLTQVDDLGEETLEFLMTRL